MSYNFKIEVERETDGRWIAEIRALPGVMVYGKTRADAVRSVYALALRVLADRIEGPGKRLPRTSNFLLPAPADSP
jgi:predicted RNase H-like HicB family nuclease